MARLRTIFLVGLILAAGLLPHKSLAAEGKKLVRLTFSTGWDALPALVAIERGFLDREQLVVSGLTVSSAAAVMRSVASRTTDFAAVPQRMPLVVAALKLPIRVVSMNGWGRKMELVVRKEDTKTKSIKDLKGKTIAMSNGSDVLPALIRLANGERLLPTEIKVKHLPAKKLAKAFKENPADAVFESRHFTSPLVQAGGSRNVFGHRKIVNALGYIGATPLITSKAMIEKEPATVQRFVNA